MRRLPALVGLKLVSGLVIAALFCGCSDADPEQPSCGFQTTVVDGACVCNAGRSDCDDDRAKEEGNGCECPGSCQGDLCVGSSGSCLPNSNNSCRSNIRYCDSATKQCKDCATGSYNCDGSNDNKCEDDKPCGSDSCDPAEKGACGETAYCDAEARTCKDCDPSWFDCDGVSSNKCEAQTSCDSPPANVCDPFIWNSCNIETRFCTNNTSPPTCRDCDADTYNCDGENATKCESQKPCGTGICDAECTKQSDFLCVKDTNQACKECLEDAHCGERVQSGGPTCDTVDKVCVCTKHEDCEARAAGIVCQASGDFKRCGCEGNEHCSYPPFTQCGSDNRCKEP